MVPRGTWWQGRGISGTLKHHTQGRELGREATTAAFRKASFLGREVETFFRALMAPGMKDIQT